MTVIKQVAVTSTAHLRNLRGYLDRDNERHEALALDSQNLVDARGWEREFDRTREAYGHNSPARAGCKVTYCYHQIIAFMPQECDVNGGKLSPEDCMAFAREWVGRYYPNQEAVWGLHRERCAADGTDRYAVHIAINRTDLETGRRLDEGRASRQKVLHASRMREMDREHGLMQLESGRRNDRVHARQRSRGEVKAERIGRAKDPGFETDLDHVRRVVKESAEKVSRSSAPNKMRALSDELDRRGVHMRMSRDKGMGNRDVVFEYRPTYQRKGRDGDRMRKASICGRRLGRGFSLPGILRALETGYRIYRVMDRMADDLYGRDE